MESMPILVTNDFICLRLKSLCWIANGVLMPAIVQSNAGKLLNDIIANYDTKKPIFINCAGIFSFEDHSLDALTGTLERNKRLIVFFNAQQFHTELKAEIGDNLMFFAEKGFIVINGITTATNYYEGIFLQIVELERDLIKKNVKHSYNKFTDGVKRLRSTPILSSGVFDTRRIISSRNDFIWISLLMAEKLVSIIENDKAKAMIRLLAVSLRGSPLAGAIGLLESKKIEIVDHMGPELKILEEYTLRSTEEKTQYVFISDLILGGTELKIAQTYAVARGCILKHALAIGTLLKPEEYKGGIEVHSLLQITDACPDLTYSIF